LIRAPRERTRDERPYGARRRWTESAWSAAILYLLAALALAGAGLLPGRVLLPLDLVRDLGAWKPDPAVRVAVSNALLSDAILQFQPWEAQARRELSAGRWPWTNPHAGEGAAIFANPAAGLLSPFTWLRLLLGDSGWALSVIAKLLVAGFGARSFARALGASPLEATASGLLYLASGYSVLWALHPQTSVFAFLPWLVASGHRLLAAPSVRSALSVTLFAALATGGGHPETLAFGVVAGGGFLLLEMRRMRRESPGAIRGSRALLLAAAAGGFLLVGVQLVPFARILSSSRVVDLRSSWPGGGIRWFSIAGQLLPGYLGSPLAGEIDLSGAFFGSGNLHVRSGAFVGVITLVVLALAWPRLSRSFRVSLGVALAALAVAWNLPPIGWVWRRLPVARLFAVEYAACAFVLFASAALGPALRVLRERTARIRVVPSALVLAGTALVCAGVLPSLGVSRGPLTETARRGIALLQARGHLRQPAEVYERRLEGYIAASAATTRRRLALPGLFWILGGTALLLRGRRAPLLAAACFGEVLSLGVGYLPAVRRSSVPGSPPPIEAILATRPSAGAMIAAAPDVFPPDLATVDGLRDVRMYEYLETRPWAAGLRRCGYDEIARAFPDRPGPAEAACLGELGVRYFLGRTAVPGAVRIGGSEPPAVGAYEIRGARAAPPPRDGPPRGLLAGLATSVAGLVVAAAAARAAARSGAPQTV